MARYAAFLRGVSPMNAKMPAKRIATFLRRPPAGNVKLPVEQSGAAILAVKAP